VPVFPVCEAADGVLSQGRCVAQADSPLSTIYTVISRAVHNPAGRPHLPRSRQGNPASNYAAHWHPPCSDHPSWVPGTNTNCSSSQPGRGSLGTRDGHAHPWLPWRLGQRCDLDVNTFDLPGAALAGVPVRTGSRRELNLDRSDRHVPLQPRGPRALTKVAANSQAGRRMVGLERPALESIAATPNALALAQSPNRSKLKRESSPAVSRSRLGSPAIDDHRRACEARRSDAPRPSARPCPGRPTCHAGPETPAPAA
jgi:hypothetical protein